MNSQAQLALMARNRFSDYTTTAPMNDNSGYYDHSASTGAEFGLLDLVKGNSGGCSTAALAADRREKKGSIGGGINHRFPVLLHYVLDCAEAEGQSNVISWQPHGRCFKVHDRPLFIKNFLPNWFRQKELASFQRQLNLYSFKRITVGPDKGAYYHELFLRGKPFLSYHINRTTKKCKGPRKPANPDTEPNFYQMPFLPPSLSTSGRQPQPQFSNNSGNWNNLMMKPWQQQQQLLTQTAAASESVTSYNPLFQQYGGINSQLTLRSLLPPVFAENASSLAYRVAGDDSRNKKETSAIPSSSSTRVDNGCITQALAGFDHSNGGWTFSAPSAHGAQGLFSSPIQGTGNNGAALRSGTNFMQHESNNFSLPKEGAAGTEMYNNPLDFPLSYDL